MTRPRRPEAIAQSRATALYRAVGCTVLSTSQTRKSRVAIGLPDLLVLHPRSGRAFWHEVKAPGGRVSPAQLDVHDTMRQAGLTVIVGDERAAEAHLIGLGLLGIKVLDRIGKGIA